jgi:hypothetical protein
MGVMMTPAATATPAMTGPSFHAGPAHSQEQDGQRERDRDAGDVENVPKRVVGALRFRRLYLLRIRDEHQTSGAVPTRTCLRKRG